MTVAEALARTRERLAAAGVPTPDADAHWLLAHVTGATRSGLSLMRDRSLAEEAVSGLEALVERRARREPLAYVLGEWGFRRLTLRMDARALVPRPETEVVVERCLALLDGVEAPRVLDVGTGSGAIALALADELPDARVVGVDVSPDALALARENAQRLGLAVELRRTGAEAAAEGWDLVVSNPPYVQADELEALEPEVRDWEPHSALLDTGLAAELARAARTRFLVLEVAEARAGALAADLASVGYDEVRITRDLAGKQRVIEGRRP